MASGPDNDAARWDCRTARARQARPKGVIPVHQCQNPLERGTRLKPDGYGPGQAVSESPEQRGTSPDRRMNAPGRNHGACPRERRDSAAGEELGADPDKRTVVIVGTVPVSPTRPSGCRQSAASADGVGMGRSSRSSRRSHDRHGGRESRPQGDMSRATYRPLCCAKKYVALVRDSARGRSAGWAARLLAARERNIFRLA